jgi:glycosyltransferase involved in cell wall biosynthesis
MTASKLAIVPAYNEEASVARVVTAIHEHAPDFDVLVVYDGSTDRASAEAERAGLRAGSSRPREQPEQAAAPRGE